METTLEHKMRPRLEPLRTALGEVVPLRTPYVVFLDPSSSCNFQCTFCPTGDRPLIKSTGRYQGNLSLADYEKAISDIGDFGEPLKVLRLYKDGEPLLNKNLSKMIAIARDAGIAKSIDTTTNGLLLDGRTGEALVGAGLSRINISVDGLSDDQFASFTRSRVSFEKFVDNIKDFYSVSGDCEVVIKTTSEIIGLENHDRFYTTFADYCDRIFIENVAPCWPDFAVEERMDITITDGLYGNAINDVSVCPYLFYSISINSDLSVSACFVDWSRGLQVGSLRTASLREIWHGQEMQSHRLSHLRGRRDNHHICGKCSQITHCGADNIDGDKVAMLEAFASSSHPGQLSEKVLREYDDAK